MTSWKKVKLGDVADVRGGKRLPKGDELTAQRTIHPYIRVTDMGSRFIDKNKLLYVSESTFKSISRYIVNTDDIIVSIVGTIGAVAKIDRQLDNASLTENCVKFHIKNKYELDSDFLYYFLISDTGQNEIAIKTVGSTQPKLPIYNIKDINISLPDYPTQTRIASILSALDDKIELNRQMNHTLEQMAQALFKKYFVDDIDKVVALPEYIELNPKISIKKNELVKYVEMANLPQNGSSISDYIVRSFNSGSKFQNNDTLLARITPCLENGKTGFVNFLQENESAYGSTEFIVMRAKQFISPYYVYFVARSDSFRQHAIRSMVGTSGRQRVQTEMLNDFELNECEPSKMKQFHQFADTAFMKIKANSNAIKVLEELRDNLLPKLMSGEIEIKEAETIMA